MMKERQNEIGRMRFSKERYKYAKMRTLRSLTYWKSG